MEFKDIYSDNENSNVMVTHRIWWQRPHLQVLRMHLFILILLEMCMSIDYVNYTIQTFWCAFISQRASSNPWSSQTWSFFLCAFPPLPLCCCVFFQTISPYAAAAAAGPIKLLTHPVSSGYNQNPISIYFCYDQRGSLVICIAEVSPTFLPEFRPLLSSCLSAELSLNFDPGLEIPCVSAFWQVQSCSVGLSACLVYG